MKQSSSIWLVFKKLLEGAASSSSSRGKSMGFLESHKVRKCPRDVDAECTKLTEIYRVTIHQCRLTVSCCPSGFLWVNSTFVQAVPLPPKLANKFWGTLAERSAISSGECLLVSLALYRPPDPVNTEAENLPMNLAGNPVLVSAQAKGACSASHLLWDLLLNLSNRHMWKYCFTKQLLSFMSLERKYHLAIRC